jgi:hypothetical protein
MKNIVFVFLLLLVQNSFAQVQIFGGVNYAFVREHSLPKTEPIWGGQWGFGITVYPNRAWQKFSITTNAVLATKGYEQHVRQTYRFELFYTGIQLLSNYRFNANVEVHSGIEFMNFQTSSVYNSDFNFRSDDIGIVTGLIIRPEKRLSIYAQGTLGLLPIIDYYDIDAAGNFNGRIRDVRNTCITVGLKFKIIKRKFYVW